MIITGLRNNRSLSAALAAGTLYTGETRPKSFHENNIRSVFLTPESFAQVAYSLHIEYIVFFVRKGCSSYVFSSKKCGAISVFRGFLLILPLNQSLHNGEKISCDNNSLPGSCSFVGVLLFDVFLFVLLYSYLLVKYQSSLPSQCE